MRAHALLLLPILALASCAAESRQPPTSSAVVGAMPASKEPEAANSLPLGSRVNTPLTQPEGNVNTVRVGPGAPRTSGY